MKQSRRASTLEVCCSTAFGFGIAWVANILILPLFPQPSWWDSFLIALIFTGISFARQYVFRRIFNHLQWIGVVK